MGLSLVNPPFLVAREAIVRDVSQSVIYRWWIIHV